MNNRSREALTVIVQHYGEIALDARRCEALLNDFLAGEYQADRFTLVLAAREGIANTLWHVRTSSSSPVLHNLISRLANQLLELGLRNDVAFEAVEAWAEAVGIIPGSASVQSSSDADFFTSHIEHLEEAHVVLLDGSDWFSSIGAALDRAGHGGVLYLQPGIYREQFTIRKHVEIVGNGPAEDVVIEVPSDGCITIGTPTDVALRSLTVRHQMPRRLCHALVEVQRGNLMIEDCVLLSGGETAAVHASGSLTHLRLQDTSVQAAGGQPITVEKDASGSLEQCTLKGGSSAVYASASSSVHIHDCTFTGQTGSSVLLEHSASATLTQCVISGSSVGITISGKSEVLIADCHIYMNTYAGVNFCDDSRGTLMSSELSDNSLGVFLSDCIGPVLEACRIRSSSNAGIHIKHSQVRIKDSEVSRNGYCGIYVTGKSTVAVEASQIHDNAREAVRIQEASRIEIRTSKLSSNTDEVYRVDDDCVIVIDDNANM